MEKMKIGKIMIINGSPRAPKSNSKRYAEIFAGYCGSTPAEYFNLTRRNHAELCGRMAEFTDIVLVFPLYADSLPVGLLDFLKTMESMQPASRPVISVMINCGFFEYQQNDLAVEMIRLFCRKNGYRFGSVLKIGSGEAILDIPGFRLLVKRKIRRFAASVLASGYGEFHVTMPLPKRLFVMASTIYWSNYGKKYGVTKSQMKTMEIEGQ